MAHPCVSTFLLLTHVALRLAEAFAQWKQARLDDSKPELVAGIGLHVGPVIGGVLKSGSHDEFTVIGAAVNVVQRLERQSTSSQSRWYPTRRWPRRL